MQLKKTFVLEGCFGVLGFEIELYARPKFKSCERNRQRAQKSISFEVVFSLLGISKASKSRLKVETSGDVSTLALTGP